MADKRIDGLRSRRSKLVRYVHLCDEYKSLIARELKSLDVLYTSKKITHAQYKLRSEEILQNKTTKQWINYYDRLILGYEAKIRAITSEIRNIEKQKEKSKNSSIIIGAVAVALMLVGLFAFSDAPLRITGMVATLANVTVENTAPIVTNVNITPQNPITTDNLTCLGTTSDANLDEVTVYYKWYINGALNTALNDLANISSENTTKGELWICEITPFDGLINGTPVNSTPESIGNTEPSLNLAELYPAAPYTTDNLTLNITCLDDDSADTLTAYWNIYLNDSLAAEFTSSQIISNGTEASIIVVNSTDTSKHETWLAEAWCGDGTSNTTEQNTTSRLIQNSLPSIPSQLTPTNGNDSLFYRNVSFDWQDSSDADNDPITYELNITSIALKTNILYSNYTLQEHLDVDTWYNWTIRAYDGESYSNFSSSWNFMIPSSVIINLISNKTSFGELHHQDIRNTTSGYASPFEVENIGNVITDIRIMALDSLWDSVGLNTNYFQFMAGNSTEENSFSWAGSKTSWYNITDESVVVIDSLKYNLTSNSAKIEFNIEVPAYEATGPKDSAIVATGVIS